MHHSQRSLLGRFLESAIDDPERVAMVVRGADGAIEARRSRDQLRAHVLAVATVIRHRIPPGCRIAIDVGEAPSAVAAQLALTAAGCTFVPLQPGAHPAEVLRDARRASCRLALVDARTADAHLDALDEATGRPSLDVSTVDPDQALPFTQPPAVEMAAEAAIFFSSGSDCCPQGRRLQPRSTCVSSAGVV